MSAEHSDTRTPRAAGQWAAALMCLAALAGIALVTDRQERWDLLAAGAVGALLAAAAMKLVSSRATGSPAAGEADMRTVLDRIPGFVHTLTPAGEVDYVNKRILDYFGMSAEDLRDWSRATHPDDIARIGAILEHSLRTGTPFDAESRARRADGTYRWLHCRGVPWHDERGRIVRWYHCLTDIDDRKQAEEQLRMREKELAQIIETLPACIWCASPDGELIYVNNRVLEYTGANFEQLKGDSFEHIHPDDRHIVVEAWKEAARTESPYETLYRKRRADGSFHWVQSIGRLGRDEQGRPARWYGLFIDVNQRVQTEEALRDTRARLARATQVATAGELAAAIAHEINQPLAAVIAHAHACNSWLTADPPNLARALLSLQRIVRDGKDAGDVIEKTRALYRHALPVKTLLNINDVIEESCHLIEAEARRRSVTLRMSLDSSLPLVPADRMQLQQILVNLMRNALEAMDSVTSRARQLRIASIQENDRVIVEVQDNGVGVEHFTSAFEPFFTTKPHGMGMGLAICRSIIEGHGGRLWAVRAAPFGAVFSFSLPLTAEGNAEHDPVVLGA